MLDKLPGKLKNEMTLIIEGQEIIFSKGELFLSIDTCAHAFSCELPWFPGLDPKFDEITKPFSYSECGVYIGGALQMEGILYDITNTRNNSGTTKKLEIYSKTADIIDSSVRSPFSERNVTLLDRCNSQMKEFEIDVVLDAGVDVGGKFTRVEVEQTDNCFSELAKLASQRGLLLSCNKKGDLLIIKPNVDGQPVGTIQEENPIANTYTASFKGRDRFQRYEAIASSSKSSKTKLKQPAVDSGISRNRFLTFTASDSLPGEAKNAAEWRKNKSAADALTFNFPVNSGYAPNNELWSVNTTVTVKSEIIGAKKGFTFLISQVKFGYDTEGLVAELMLKPPKSYTTGEVNQPWD